MMTSLLVKQQLDQLVDRNELLLSHTQNLCTNPSSSSKASGSGSGSGLIYPYQFTLQTHTQTHVLVKYC